MSFIAAGIFSTLLTRSGSRILTQPRPTPSSARAMQRSGLHNSRVKSRLRHCVASERVPSGALAIAYDTKVNRRCENSLQGQARVEVGPLPGVNLVLLQTSVLKRLKDLFPDCFGLDDDEPPGLHKSH